MNNFFKKAISLIDNKKCTVGIIGLWLCWFAPINLIC